jgi:hypothetical protein
MVIMIVAMRSNDKIHVVVKRKMKNTVLLLIENIKTYTGYYFAVTSAVGILWGGFVLFDNWRDSNVVLVSTVKTIRETQIQQGKTDSLLLVNQTAMEKKLNEIQLRTNDASSSIRSLSTSYVKYISNDQSLSKEDFLKYMDGLSLDVKKNLLMNQTISPVSIPMIVLK